MAIWKSKHKIALNFKFVSIDRFKTRILLTQMKLNFHDTKNKHKCTKMNWNCTFLLLLNLVSLWRASKHIVRTPNIVTNDLACQFNMQIMFTFVHCHYRKAHHKSIDTFTTTHSHPYLPNRIQYCCGHMDFAWCITHITFSLNFYCTWTELLNIRCTILCLRIKHYYYFTLCSAVYKYVWVKWTKRYQCGSAAVALIQLNKWKATIQPIDFSLSSLMYFK